MHFVIWIGAEVPVVEGDSVKVLLKNGYIGISYTARQVFQVEVVTDKSFFCAIVRYIVIVVRRQV